MSNFLKIKDHLLQSIPDIEKVWTEEMRTDFRIIDYKGQSYILQNIDIKKRKCSIKQADNSVETIDFDELKSFFVQKAQQVIFIPIDGKNGLIRSAESHCDCVLFDMHDFCFIEFKLNTISEKKISKNRYKAVNQLTNTISFFDEKLSLDYKGLQLEAYICTPDFYPKENAEWEDIRVDFLEEKGVRLYETREKMCR